MRPTTSAADLVRFLESNGYVADDGDGMNSSQKHVVIKTFEGDALVFMKQQVASGELKRTMILEPGCGPIYVTHNKDNEYVNKYSVNIVYTNRPEDEIEL